MKQPHSSVQNIMREELSKIPPSKRAYDYPRNYKIKSEDNGINGATVMLWVLAAFFLMALIGGN